jgi:predicted nuclease of predicted toxin-antitoxin system
MTIWIDAQLSPAIAVWINQNFAVNAIAVRDLGLRDAEDDEIFLAAKKANAIVMTKDSDFLFLLDRFGVPPQIIWLTCGNTSNARLKEILTLTLENAIQFLENGEEIVEINSI